MMKTVFYFLMCVAAIFVAFVAWRLVDGYRSGWVDEVPNCVQFTFDRKGVSPEETLSFLRRLMEENKISLPVRDRPMMLFGKGKNVDVLWQYPSPNLDLKDSLIHICGTGTTLEWQSIARTFQDRLSEKFHLYKAAIQLNPAIHSCNRPGCLIPVSVPVNFDELNATLLKPKAK